MQWEPAENLIPLDPEIERTLKRILRDKRESVRMEQLPIGPMEENRDDMLVRLEEVVYILMPQISIATYQGLWFPVCNYSTCDSKTNNTSEQFRA